MIRFVLVALVFAALVYLLVRVIERRGRLMPPRRPDVPRRVVAPDDDEQFLRDLEKKRRKRDEPESS